MQWNQFLRRAWTQGQTLVQESVGDLSLLVDLSQLNRRTRAAWLRGRFSRAWYLFTHHQRRRITRRREIRRLIEG